jgi:hypothetical protein
MVPSSPYPNMLPPVSNGLCFYVRPAHWIISVRFRTVLNIDFIELFLAQRPPNIPLAQPPRESHFEDLLKRKRIAFFGLPAQRRRNVILTDPTRSDNCYCHGGSFILAPGSNFWETPIGGSPRG